MDRGMRAKRRQLRDQGLAIFAGGAASRIAIEKMAKSRLGAAAAASGGAAIPSTPRLGPLLADTSRIEDSEPGIAGGPPPMFDLGGGASAMTPQRSDGAGGGGGGGGGGSSDPLAATSITEPDEEDSTDPFTIDIKLSVALPQAVWLTAGGAGFCFAGVFLGTSNAPVFIFLLCAGAMLLCATTAGVNQSMMAAVRPESRSFAIGIGTMLLHALGDVPAPPIIGALADHLSPQTCAGDDDSGGSGGSVSAVAGTLGASNCTRSSSGLQFTLLLVMSWLVWPIVLWAAA
jgi:hypothetical protein